MFTVTSHEILWIIVVNHKPDINMDDNNRKEIKQIQPTLNGHF